MNLADLTSKIEANKKPLAIAGAAGVAGLALMQRKKAGGDVGTTPAPTTSSVTSAGSLAAPNGQVVYSSEASDVYNAIQPQLSTIGTSVNQLLADKAKADSNDTIPLAASLFSPTFSGTYLRDNKGSIVEVQGDGSLYGLTGNDWAEVEKRNGGIGSTKLTQIASLPSFFSLEKNVAKANTSS